MEWNYKGALIKINKKGKFEVFDCKAGLKLKHLSDISLDGLKTKITKELPKEECFYVPKHYLYTPIKISFFVYFPEGHSGTSFENYLEINKKHPQFNEIKKEYLKYKNFKNEIWEKHKELEKILNENTFKITINSL